MPPVSRGFKGRRREGVDATRIPPGQHLVRDFPVLTYGPTPQVDTARWSFSLDGAVSAGRRWSWDEFQAMPREQVTTDIHCVTTWSKLDTTWSGVPVDAFFAGIEPGGGFVQAWCDGGYTTNLPLDDVLGGRAWVVDRYDGAPLAPAHGGPARLLVPHLYFWKSAKWVRGLTVTVQNEPGFWEENGYHDRGDPWREERYGAAFE
ncbi:MAG: sulfite oxidase-like oxidoreductase [Patulibacter minatonensis]